MQKLYQSINKILKLAHRLSFAYPSLILRLSYIECKGYIRREKKILRISKMFRIFVARK